jgi:putative FmdB family regulatory protein
MPIYEYQCPQCGRFEIMQKVREAILKRCPTCKSKVSKLISNTSFQLKGTGWYVTDYGRKDKAAGPARASEDKDSKPEASKKKTETKGETKSKEASAA